MESSYARRFEEVAPTLATIGIALLPFKLNLSYAFLIPLLIGWIIFDARSWLRSFDHFPTSIKIFIAFLCAAALTSPFGLSPLHSLENLWGFFFYPLLIPVFWKLGKEHFNKITIGLCVGLTIASILNAARDGALQLNTKFIGSVSQSGQLGIALFLIGILWLQNGQKARDSIAQCAHCSIRAPLISVGILGLIASLLCIGWSSYWPEIESLAMIGVALLMLGVFLIWIATKKQFLLLAPFTVCLPILTATLLVNLKRGPWLGVISGLTLLAFTTGKKRFLTPVILALVIAFSVAPMRERIFLAKDHFFITGGRSEIWQIGFELLQKYPLGIGLENSGFLRDFSATIPHNLKHFHSNLLNIAVETGWLGASLFFAFFVALLYTFIAARHRTASASWLAAGITSWFCAGLVEYNFGDSAVCNMLYVFIGLGFSLIAAYPSSRSQN